MSYIKTGNRVSLLPISAHCGLAAQLSEAHGAGRSAALSTAFHAREAGAPDATEKLARLSPEELQTISTWKCPTDVQVQGHTLRYEDAHKEVPLGLTATGEFAEDGEVLTCGTTDFYWISNGVAFVGDMKKTRWTCTGPDSLQLLAYGYAVAKKHECGSFCVGLWIIEDAEWQWSTEVYSMNDWSSLDLWGRIAYAASNTTGEASFGDHCSNCYGRLHCPEYTLPFQFADTVLAPAAVGGAIDDPGKLADMLLFVERFQAMAEKVKDFAKEAVRRGVVLEHGGKVYKPTQCKGRESLNQAKLFAAIPEASKFVERGNPYDRFTWSKVRGAK